MDKKLLLNHNKQLTILNLILLIYNCCNLILNVTTFTVSAIIFTREQVRLNFSNNIYSSNIKITVYQKGIRNSLFQNT